MSILEQAVSQFKQNRSAVPSMKSLRAPVALLLLALLVAHVPCGTASGDGMCTSPEVVCAGGGETQPACSGGATEGAGDGGSCAAPGAPVPSSQGEPPPPPPLPCPRLADLPGGRSAVDLATLDPVTECARQLLAEVLAFDAAAAAEGGSPGGGGTGTGADAAEPIDPGTSRTSDSWPPWTGEAAINQRQGALACLWAGALLTDRGVGVGGISLLCLEATVIGDALPHPTPAPLYPPPVLLWTATARDNAKHDVAMGIVFYDRGELESALELLRRATGSDPACMSAWAFLGRVCTLPHG
jgi:hypothetical protein